MIDNKHAVPACEITVPIVLNVPIFFQPAVLEKPQKCLVKNGDGTDSSYADKEPVYVAEQVFCSL